MFFNFALHLPTPTLINAFIQGWKMGFQSWRVGLIVYTIQFLLALVIGMLAASELTEPISRSLELEKLLKGYDHTIFSDLANVHGDFMNIIAGSLPWLVLVWMIFSVFINGGLLFTIEKKQPTWDIFWAGGARFFLPFLQIGLFFLIITAVLSALIWTPLVSNFEDIIRSLPSEREYVFILIGVIFFFILLLLFLFGWATSSKLFYLKREISVWKSIKTGFHFVRKNFKSTEGLLLLFVLVQLLVVGIYWLLEGTSGMINPILIFVFFLIQQMVIFFRIIWRISSYAALNELIEWRDNWYRELID